MTTATTRPVKRAPPSVRMIPLWPDADKESLLARRRVTASCAPVWQPNPDHPDGRPNPQRLAYESAADVLGYGGAAGGGKALSVDTAILTTAGWTTMGEIQPGDEVFGRDGHPVAVLAASAVMMGRACYRLTLDDGATLVADGEHEWLTFSLSELNSLTRRTEAFRERRRGARPSRVSGNKSERFTQRIVARNRSNPPAIKPPPAGTVRTTAEMAASVVARGRTNYAIPLAEGLVWPERSLPLDPYLLGVWLGDGTSKSGSITTADAEIVEAFRAGGFEVRKRSAAYGWGVLGLQERLRSMGLLGCKHIPEVYLRADRAARLALLQGLMDTDGTVATASGSAEFTNTNEALAQGALALILSLGHKAVLREGRARLRGRDCGAKYTIKWMAPELVFRLERKRVRQKLATRPTTRFRYVAGCEPVESVPVRCIQVAAADGLFLAGRKLVLTHNSSLLLGLAATAHRRSAVFRRVFPNLRGIIEESRALLNAEGRDHSKDRYNEALHRWMLADGRMIEFEACQYEKDKEKQRGRPRDFYGFDEATEFTRTQVEFITAWNRTTEAGQRCRVVMTFNPPTDDGGSWVIEYFRPWLAHLFPKQFTHSRPAMPGELRWYATVDGKEVECEDGEVFGHGGEQIRPRSRTFIPARLDDNPHLADSNYRSTLQALPEPLRSQLLLGDFAAKAAADPFQIIPAEWVRLAQRRWIERVDMEGAGPDWRERPTAVGVDVARAGADRTVFAPRWGQWYGEPAIYPGAATPDGPVVAELLRQRWADVGQVNVDVIGIGSSAYDSIRVTHGLGLMGKGVRPVNVSAGSSYTDKSGRLRMRNLRTELLWRMRDALDPAGGSEVALPPGNEVVADLCAARYRPLAGGVAAAESKEEIKARLGRSPDVGDALLLAMYEPAEGASWDDLGGLEIKGFKSMWD